MQARGGITWWVAAFGLFLLLGAPLPVGASGVPIYLADASNSMEAQMVGEKPPQTAPSASLYPNLTPSLRANQDGATFKLPYNVEMNISVHYRGDTSSQEPQRFSESPLLMKYSMGYRFLPNLQVGLNSYLYRPEEDGLILQHHLSSRVGFGPELKYNLGRWSFLLKSQMESGSRDHPEGLQNWLRVWYAY